jgi:hypothetical protein
MCCKTFRIYAHVEGIVNAGSYIGMAMYTFYKNNTTHTARVCVAQHRYGLLYT